LINVLHLHETVSFRELPSLSQQIVMRLLFVEQEVPKAVVTSWVTSGHKDAEEAATRALTDLGVWAECMAHGGMMAWKLNGTFRENLRRALTGGGDPWTMSATLEPDKNPRDKGFLDKYSEERWATVLHYMVGSRQQEGISVDAVQVLTEANLIVRDESNEVAITRSGFQFLLMDTPSQVWYFMLQYLETCSKYHLDVTECLNFLFQLSFSELGKVRPGIPYFYYNIKLFN
jgi:transcription initiation factor TFIIH subunit 4